MGRRKNKQAPVATVSMPEPESKMNPVQTAGTTSSENRNTLKSGEGEATKWFDSQPVISDLLAVPLPDTPVKPSLKKSKREYSGRDDASVEILAAIREFREEMFQKISTIDKTTAVTAQQVESLSSTVHQLVTEVATQKEALKVVSAEIQDLKLVNKTLKEEVGDCKRYSWRWTLKLHGVQEKDGEDVRRVAIDILSNVVPGISERMEDAVDIAHRLGPRRKDGTCRSIIILFALRRYRDTVWQAARGCKFLRDNKLRLTEALSPEDRVAREKLWPLVKKARDEGKKASFRGSFALIDGKRFDFVSVK